MKTFTKQGVRNLNHIKGKSVGVKLSPVPQSQEACKHKLKQNLYGDNTCLDCGECFEWKER